MSDNEEAKPAEQDNGGIVLDLDFAPSWARNSPEAHIKRYQNERFENESADNRSHRRGHGDSHERRTKRRDFDDSPRRPFERKPRRDNERDKNSEMRQPDSRAAFADLKVEPSSQANQSHRRGDSRNFRQEAPQLPLEIRVLPEQKALGAVIRRIQTSHRAFPLRDIAWLFLDNPASCLIRIEPIKDQQLALFQCKVCGLPGLSEDEIKAHLLSRHMEDYFDCEEVDCEPPTGSFVCVARCGLSGTLLGPPNHHGFNAKVNEMLRTRYANMSEENYRSRIETVRDPEVIEQWRQQCTKKLVYRRKGASVTAIEPVVQPDAEPEGGECQDGPEDAPRPPPMEREIAEMVFMREIVPSQIASVRHMVCTAAVAMQTTSRPLYFALKDVLNRERRFPASLFFALRGAFRHRKLHLFRIHDARGPDFVMLKPAVALDPAHTVQTLSEVLTYVNEHPACTKAEMVMTLAGGDEEKIKETLVQLAWLVEKGHVIEYYNEVLSAPLEYPVFRILPGEKQTGGRKDEAPAHRRTSPRNSASDGQGRPASVSAEVQTEQAQEAQSGQSQAELPEQAQETQPKKAQEAQPVADQQDVAIASDKEDVSAAAEEQPAKVTAAATEEREASISSDPNPAPVN